MARTGNGAVSVSFFQKRICSCMVDPKMNQCADPIDTQHNVLFDVWRRNVPQWLDETTCSREGCPPCPAALVRGQVDLTWP